MNCAGRRSDTACLGRFGRGAARPGTAPDGRSSRSASRSLADQAMPDTGPPGHGAQAASVRCSPALHPPGCPAPRLAVMAGGPRPASARPRTGSGLRGRALPPAASASSLSRVTAGGSGDARCTAEALRSSPHHPDNQFGARPRRTDIAGVGEYKADVRFINVEVRSQSVTHQSAADRRCERGGWPVSSRGTDQVVRAAWERSYSAGWNGARHPG
jgi:hypothetical protein